MKKIKDISEDTIICRNPAVHYSTIDDEIVMMTPDSANYVKLNETSSIIWESLKVQKTFRDLINVLIERYDVNEKECIQETKKLLEKAILLNLLITK